MPKKRTAQDPTVLVTPEDYALMARKFSLPQDLLAPATTKARKGSARRTQRAASPPLAGWEEGPPAGERKYYQDFPVGRFEGDPVLVWIAPDRFLHLPRPEAPFRFVRANGDIVQPGRMYTDGGSIPRALWMFEGFSPWHYAPAYLIHDWLFDSHHCGQTDLSFEAVRDIMMEGVRTLMESGRCKKDRGVFDLIYTGIDSPIARSLWAKGKCALPPQS